MLQDLSLGVMNTVHETPAPLKSPRHLSEFPNQHSGQGHISGSNFSLKAIN
jgi:hypothetical protein